jgi:hypothetical protein
MCLPPSLPLIVAIRILMLDGQSRHLRLVGHDVSCGFIDLDFS